MEMSIEFKEALKKEIERQLSETPVWNEEQFSMDMDTAVFDTMTELKDDECVRYNVAAEGWQQAG